MADSHSGACVPGVRVTAPPGRVSVPTSVTWKFVGKDEVRRLPPLNEGEALAARVLEVGPTGKLPGHVIVEVRHYASLCDGQRQVVVLRSENGADWREHKPTDDVDCEEKSEPQQGSDRFARISTDDLPLYFALVTRAKMDTLPVKVEGTTIRSKVAPQVQAVYRAGAVTKMVNIGLKVQTVSPDFVSNLFGNRAACGPFVSLVPVRRKFHQAITVTSPVPSTVQKDASNPKSKLRLLCSIMPGTDASKWDDVTDRTVLTLSPDCQTVTFDSTVSARFCLVHCDSSHDAVTIATTVYQEAIAVPYMAQCLVLAKRTADSDLQLKIFCVTGDVIDRTSANHEDFKELARSGEVEVVQGRPLYVQMTDNLILITDSSDDLAVTFEAFLENCLDCMVHVLGEEEDPEARLTFTKEPRGSAIQTPVCQLDFTLA